MPGLHRRDIIESSLEQYCTNLKTRIEKSSDFDSKRQLLLDYIEKIVFVKETVEIHGSVSILLDAYRDHDQTSESGKIKFVLVNQLTKP
jgi:hypothetical protein